VLVLLFVQNNMPAKVDIHNVEMPNSIAYQSHNNDLTSRVLNLVMNLCNTSLWYLSRVCVGKIQHWYV